VEENRENNEVKQKSKVSRLSQKAQEIRQKSKSVATAEGSRLSPSDWVKIVTINALITLGILLLYHVKFAPPSVSIVDLKGYLANLQSLYLQGKITQEEAKEKLDKAIDIIQREAKNAVVFSSDVVFGRNNKVKKLELPELPEVSSSSLAPKHGESQQEGTKAPEK